MTSSLITRRDRHDDHGEHDDGTRALNPPTERRAASWRCQRGQDACFAADYWVLRVGLSGSRRLVVVPLPRSCR